MERYSLAIDTHDISVVKNYIDNLIKENKIKKYHSKYRKFIIYKFAITAEIFREHIWRNKKISVNCYIAPYFSCNEKKTINNYDDYLFRYDMYCSYKIPKQIERKFVLSTHTTYAIKQKFLRKISIRQPFIYFISTYNYCIRCYSKTHGVFCYSCAYDAKAQITNKTVAYHWSNNSFMLYPAGQDINADLMAVYTSAERGANNIIYGRPFIVV